MMEKNRITTLQLTFFIIQTQIGVGVLGLPFAVESVAKGDSWIAIILAGLVTQLLIFLLWLLGNRFSNLSFFEYSSVVLGPFFGKTINFLYIVYGLFVCSLILLSFSSIIQTWILLSTPKWIILLLLLLTAVYLAKGSVEDISNFYVIVSVLIPFVLVLSTLVLFTYSLDIRFLFPIGEAGLTGIAKGIQKVYFSMLGFEVMLILYPLVKCKKKTSILKAASVANWIVTGFYTLLTIICLIVFSPEEIKIIPQPVLYLVKALYLQIIERIDLLFLSLWMVNVTTSVISYLFFSIEGILSLKPKWKRGYTAAALAFFSFTIAMVPQTPKETEIFNKIILNFSYFFVIIIPVCLLLLAVLFKKGKRGAACEK